MGVHRSGTERTDIKLRHSPCTGVVPKRHAMMLFCHINTEFQPIPVMLIVSAPHTKINTCPMQVPFPPNGNVLHTLTQWSVIVALCHHESPPPLQLDHMPPEISHAHEPSTDSFI
ncbi:hypothetical protein O0L34_g12946 [Tuta absoluta]|nr:hypothetical protein O0L34_g12946 [Tuta absoluta]